MHDDLLVCCLYNETRSGVTINVHISGISVGHYQIQKYSRLSDACILIDQTYFKSAIFVFSP